MQSAPINAREIHPTAVAVIIRCFIGRSYAKCRVGWVDRQLLQSDGMRRPVSGRDAIRSQVIDVLKAQIKGDRNEEG
jgi:hypothetical protein